MPNVMIMYHNVYGLEGEKYLEGDVVEWPQELIDQITAQDEKAGQKPRIRPITAPKKRAPKKPVKTDEAG